jgi:hypothetical protein
MGHVDQQSTEQIEAENRILHRVIEAISSSLDLDVVLHETIALVIEATRGDACFPSPVGTGAAGPHPACRLRGFSGCGRHGHARDG